MRTRRRVVMWLAMAALALMTAVGPAAAGPARPVRCRVVMNGRAMYMVCPCRGVTYRCEDWWGPIRRWRG